MTADHCVRGLKTDQVQIMNPLDDYSDFQCIYIHHHSQADIAISEVSGKIPKQFERFKLTEKDIVYGAQIHCFGMNLDLFDDSRFNSPARVIGGIIQRDFLYRDGVYESFVLELSTPIPKGTSGGHAFFANKDDTVIGMAIGTIKSEVVVSSFEEYENEKIKERERISEIIRYGVILRLLKVKDWLETIMPIKDN